MGAGCPLADVQAFADSRFEYPSRTKCKTSTSRGVSPCRALALDLANRIGAQLSGASASASATASARGSARPAAHAAANAGSPRPAWARATA